MDFPNQHSFCHQGKRSNTEVWLGLWKRLKGNREASLFGSCSVQQDKLKCKLALFLQPTQLKGNKKKPRGWYAVSQDGTSWTSSNTSLTEVDRSLPHQRGCKQEVSCWLCIIDIRCVKNHCFSKDSRRRWQYSPRWKPKCSIPFLISNAARCKV